MNVMISVDTINEVVKEMRHAESKGWTRQHDEIAGSGHLVKEAVYRLTHMGEHPTDEAVQHEIIVALGLLFNAHRTLGTSLLKEWIAEGVDLPTMLDRLARVNPAYADRMESLIEEANAEVTSLIDPSRSRDQ